jgi:hypothetical protein
VIYEEAFEGFGHQDDIPRRDWVLSRLYHCILFGWRCCSDAIDILLNHTSTSPSIVSFTSFLDQWNRRQSSNPVRVDHLQQFNSILGSSGHDSRTDRQKQRRESEIDQLHVNIGSFRWRLLTMNSQRMVCWEWGSRSHVGQIHLKYYRERPPRRLTIGKISSHVGQSFISCCGSLSCYSYALSRCATNNRRDSCLVR